MTWEHFAGYLRSPRSPREFWPPASTGPCRPDTLEVRPFGRPFLVFGVLKCRFAVFGGGRWRLRFRRRWRGPASSRKGRTRNPPISRQPRHHRIAQRREGATRLHGDALRRPARDQLSDLPRRRADGELFVGIDPNGSLEQQEGRRQDLRRIDSNGDGKADQINDFAEKWTAPAG